VISFTRDNRKSPSTDSTPGVVLSNQSRLDRAYYDGRKPAGTAAPNLALPVTVFHPAFAAFEARLSDPTFQAPPEVLFATSRLVGASTVLYTSEAHRNEGLREPLAFALRGRADGMRAGRARSGGRFIVSTVTPRGPALLGVIATKYEPGVGGCDPNVEAQVSADVICCAPEVNDSCTTCSLSLHC
jgi:hypothetical protein